MAPFIPLHPRPAQPPHTRSLQAGWAATHGLFVWTAVSVCFSDLPPYSITLHNTRTLCPVALLSLALAFARSIALSYSLGLVFF